MVLPGLERLPNDERRDTVLRRENAEAVSLRESRSRVPFTFVALTALFTVATWMVDDPARAAGKRKPVTAKQQLSFGVEMAGRGLWSEALFRFDQARRLEPENAQILNNVAVAHEALGLFDEALDFYRRAIKLDPENRGLRRNYSRFVEYYQNFKGGNSEDSEGESATESAEPAGDSP